MEDKLFEFNFNFTNNDLDKIFAYVYDYYTKKTSATKHTRFIKYTFLAALILGIILNILNLINGEFNASSLAIFITTIIIFIIYTQLKAPYDSFKSSFQKYIGTRPLKISISNSTISRKIISTQKTFEAKFKFINLTTILFYDDIIILVFKNFCFPIKLSQTDSNFDDIMSFLKNKLN
ncbi:hypothetical protein [uncultured Clostridium sp.]|uniref:hypothetical protein n=1 Tax=uncultured Clostridium sp. TaxID=59620 RepID=UPI002622C9A4|nr:hypothetical protein [uncultured Clostridium sp.]